MAVQRLAVTLRTNNTTRLSGNLVSDREHKLNDRDPSEGIMGTSSSIEDEPDQQNHSKVLKLTEARPSLVACIPPLENIVPLTVRTVFAFVL